MRTNSVQLIGYIGQHLFETTVHAGSRRLSLRVSTVHSYKDGSKRHYTTTWHNVVAWDKLAEFATANFVKGSRVLVEGMIVYRTYPDPLGHTRYLTEIKATSLHNLDR